MSMERCGEHSAGVVSILLVASARAAAAFAFRLRQLALGLFDAVRCSTISPLHLTFFQKWSGSNRFHSNDPFFPTALNGPFSDGTVD